MRIIVSVVFGVIVLQGCGNKGKYVTASGQAVLQGRHTDLSVEHLREADQILEEESIISPNAGIPVIKLPRTGTVTTARDTLF